MNSSVFNRRVLFMLSSQHFIPHGGIGSFTKGFTEMASRLNWKVDVLLDKAPRNKDFLSLIENAGANVLWANTTLPYINHTRTFSFSDTINFEKIINFRTGMIQAFTENLYDLIVCNTQESMTAAYAMTLHEYIPVVFYTHLHSMIFRESQGNDVFLSTYHNFYNKHMEFTDIIVGTQTERNLKELVKKGAINCKTLSMPMSERGLLEHSDYLDKRGVLFIGRWEEGKNPKVYVKVMKECKLPCKVMTNKSGAEKFKAAFQDAGIDDYEIKASISGEEKVNFIKSSKVFFNPSLKESFSFAFMECLGHMSCVVLDKQDWSDNFDDSYYHKVSLSDAAKTISALYETKQHPDALDYVKSLDDDVSNNWAKLVDDFKSKQSKTSVAKINSYNTIMYKDFIDSLNRSALAREDFESVLSNRHKFEKIIYTNDNTYLTKDADFQPIECESSLDNLFEGL